MTRHGRQLSIGTFEKKSEAIRALADATTEQHRGTWIEPSAGRMTVAAFAEQWAKGLGTLRESTRTRDLWVLKELVVANHGHIQLAQLEHLWLQEWVSEMSSAYKPATVVKAYQIMHKMLDAAVRARRIAVNPATGIKLPRIEASDRRALSMEQLHALADAIEPRFRGFVLTGGLCGLRPGELAALQAQHVDVAAGTIRVVQTASVVKGRARVGPPKTNAGRRTVPVVVPEALDVLDRLVSQVGDKPEAWLWPAKNGTVIPLDRFRRLYWQQAVAAAGLDSNVVPHELRHTAATLWRMAGVPVEVAARWLGHRDLRLVLQIYSHIADLEGVDDGVLAQLRAMAARPDDPPGKSRGSHD